MSSTVERHRQHRFRPKNVTKIYCEVNKSNGVNSRVTLDKITLLQVKVFSQNSTFTYITCQPWFVVIGITSIHVEKCNQFSRSFNL